MAEAVTQPPPGFVMAGAMPPPPPGFELAAQVSPMVERRAQPRPGSGIWDSLVAGAQDSAIGMFFRNKLPDVVLEPEHAKWYERAAKAVGSFGTDAPLMYLGQQFGSAAGGLAGGAVAGQPGAVAGAIVGGGAAMFAVPTAIRETLVQAYEDREAVNSGDFLARAGIVIKETAKSAAVGGLTMGAGALAARGVGSAIAPAIGTTLSVPAATRIIGGTQIAAEIGTMVVAPAALEGRLPEPQDFADAAVVIFGMRGAAAGAGNLAKIYAKTGVKPEEVVADAKGNPAVDAELKAVRDGELPQAYKPIAEAQMLADAMPEAPKIAEVMNNPRGTITEGKEPNHINYRYTESAQDVQLLRAKIAETMKEEIEAARGKESWNATQEKAQEIIANRLAGMSDDQKAAFSKMSFTDLAAQSMAVEALAQKAAYDVRTAAESLARKGDAATPEDARLLRASIEQSALLHAIDQGNGAEIARALNSRKAARQRAELAESMTDVLAQYGADPHVLARMVLGLHTTAQVTKFARDAAKATTWEKIVEAWKASILSGPVTQMANIMGNTTFAAMRPIVDIVAATGGRLVGASERVIAAEPLARVLGNLQGAKDALVTAGEALRVAYEDGGVRGVVKEIAVGGEGGIQKVDQFRKAIDGTVGDVVRLPFRALSLTDEFFKTVNDRGERYSLAVRQAVREDYNVNTREFRERVADLVQNDTAIATKGAEAALRFTFNTPLGAKGQAVQNLVQKANLQLVVPFIRTPANIFKEMIRLSPLAPVIKEWRQAYEAGGADRAKAVSEMAMGTTIGAVVSSLVLDGSVTGQGDPDPNKRRTDVAAGKQPYSVKVGDTYYSYQRMQPVGTLMGMAADLTEIWQHLTEDEGTKAQTMLSIAFANAVTQQTFLQGITSVVQVLADPQRYGPRFFQQYAGSVVPAAVAQITAMNDPLVREVNSIVEAVKARLPGLRETLEPRINELTGQPVQAKERLGGISPITETEASKDPVLAEAMRLRVGVPKTPKKVDLPAMGQRDIGKVELTPEQKTIFGGEGGKFIHEAMTNIIGAPEWDSMRDLERKIVFEKIIKKGHEVAGKLVLSQEQRDSEGQRIMDALAKRLAK